MHNPDWRKYAQELIDADYYKKVPWHDELEPIKDHYVVISRENPTMVSYFRSESDAIRLRRSEVRPGRYLQQFYSDKLSSVKIRELASKVAMASSQILFAKTPDEMVYVYENGPGSCMAYKESQSYTNIHPVRAYGNSDLQLAYLKKNNEITARCLVWPEKKKYLRTPYGKDYVVLEMALKDLGYEKSSSLVRAKLNKIVVPGETSKKIKLILPYIDGTKNIIIRNDNVIISGHRAKNAIYAGTTTGYVELFKECDVCKREALSTLLRRRNNSSSRLYVDVGVCGDCIKTSTFKCEILGELRHNEELFDMSDLWVTIRDKDTKQLKICFNENKPANYSKFYPNPKKKYSVFAIKNHHYQCSVTNIMSNEYGYHSTKYFMSFVYKNDRDLLYTDKSNLYCNFIHYDVLGFLKFKTSKSISGCPILSEEDLSSIQKIYKELYQKNQSKLDKTKSYTPQEFMNIIFDKNENSEKIMEAA